MSAPELAITWSRRLHYSRDLAPIPLYGNVGRHGHAICNGSYRVYDHEAFHQPGYRGHHKPVDFAAQPVCKACAKKAGGLS